MKDDVSLNRFVQAFKDMGRDNQFTQDGLKALYEYLIEFEEETGKEMELDVIGICCDFAEYENLKEYLCDYDTNIDRKDFDNSEDYEEAVKEGIQEHTTFIDIDNESFIIAQY